MINWIVALVVIGAILSATQLAAIWISIRGIEEPIRSQILDILVESKFVLPFVASFFRRNR